MTDETEIYQMNVVDSLQVCFKMGWSVCLVINT